MTDHEEMPSDVRAFLAHYGVKGMRWGVRRDLKRQATAAYNAFAEKGNAPIAFVNREITEAEYKSLSSKPILLAKAGDSFQRVVKSNSAQLRDGLVYVTKDPQDHINYLGLFPPEGNIQNRQKYSATVTVSKAVVSPSLKERVDTFISVLDKQIPHPTDPITVSGRAYVTGSVKRAEEDPAVRSLSNRELGLQYYQRWAQSQHMNTPLTQIYTSELRKKGYNAMIDDADAGMMSQMPIVLFPKESGARITEVVPITKDDELIARANIKAPEMRNQ